MWVGKKAGALLLLISSRVNYGDGRSVTIRGGISRGRYMRTEFRR